MANQLVTELYEYTIYGDGQSTALSFDLKSIFTVVSESTLQLSNPASIYPQTISGPEPIPNFTTASIQGSVVTLNFDSAFVAWDPVNQAQYTITFVLGFNS
jgi:hypothetical protein